MGMFDHNCWPLFIGFIPLVKKTVINQFHRFRDDVPIEGPFQGCENFFKNSNNDRHKFDGLVLPSSL
jgi:hypothetical protein